MFWNKKKNEKLIIEAQTKLKPVLVEIFKENDECGYYGKYLFGAPCKELEGEYATMAASYANKGMDFDLSGLDETKILGLISNLSEKEIQEMILSLDKKGAMQNE